MTISEGQSKTFRKFIFHTFLNFLVIGVIAKFILDAQNASLNDNIVTFILILIVSIADSWFRFYRHWY